jgi:carbonic anhydrase/acetyltransferase-like protein (isoleucine patch superfamily)
VIASLEDRHPVFEGEEHYVAHNASLIGLVRLKHRASIWFNAVLRGDNDWIEIGHNSNIQDACVLHTDLGICLTIGDNVSVGHQAMLHGCTIGDGSLIGIGSTVLNNAVVGRDCLVGARSLITEGKTFPDGVLIHGSPAKVVRELTSQELSMLQSAAGEYVAQSKKYLSSLRPAVEGPSA